jgi:hypothetical protein
MVHISSKGGNGYINSEGKPLQRKYEAGKAKLATDRIQLKFKNPKKDFYECQTCDIHINNLEERNKRKRKHMGIGTEEEKCPKAVKSKNNSRIGKKGKRKINHNCKTCNKGFETGSQLGTHLLN